MLTGLGGAVVLSVGAILLYKRIRTRSRAKAAAEQASDGMSQPMISSFNQSRFSFHAPASPSQAYQPSTRPPVSPQMSSASSNHDGSSGSGGSSSSGHSHNSPMSDQGSQFHFPLLSADGHLMPPVPASSRGQTWNISEGDLGMGSGVVRPLPNAPGTGTEGDGGAYDYEQYEEYQYQYDYSPNPSYEGEGGGEQGIDEKATLSYYEYQQHPEDQAREEEPMVHLVAPLPRTPKRWSYIPPHSTPSPDRSEQSRSESHETAEIVGLYPSIEFRGDGSIDYGYGYGRGRGVDDDAAASIRSSPRVAQVQDTFGFHQPQTATYHRSFSAEGEEIMADR